MRRRLLLDRLATGLAALGAWRHSSAQPAPAGPDFEPVRPGPNMAFPLDHGAHPRFRTEWWYITGWVELDGAEIGIQITFFRSRTAHTQANPSRFAPTQLLLAHAALARTVDGHLRHDQRSARLGFSDTRAATGDTDLMLRDWSLRREPDDRYLARIPAREFQFDLIFRPGAAPMPQGEQGYSRKGPLPGQASYYYSRPQLSVAGSIRLDGRAQAVRAGRAWLDHEWSSEMLDPQAVGWDWMGLNLDDGSALMAFRIRRRDGSTVWSHARWLPARTPATTPRFDVLRSWRSARSGAEYPVAMAVSIAPGSASTPGADERRLELQPLLDDQELDARSSTGGFYWEGAVRVLERGRVIGRGYLELTGYAGVQRL